MHKAPRPSGSQKLISGFYTQQGDPFGSGTRGERELSNTSVLKINQC